MTTRNQPAINILIYMSMWIDILISLGHIPRCGIAGSNLILEDISKCFPKRWSTLTFFFPFSEQKLLVVAKLMHIKSYHIVPWNFISLGRNLRRSSFVHGSLSFIFRASFICRTKDVYYFSFVCVFLTNFNGSCYFIVIKSL